MQLLKTDKARTELQIGNRTLGQRERALLILADGTNTIDTVNHLFGGEALRLAMHLVHSGYLAQPQEQAVQTKPAKPARAPEAAPPAAVQSETMRPAVSADNFEGKRSLATTRMFLFDICERMFARHDPARAEAFREALRKAKDRASMLAAAREMISAIEELAGHERADSISERIAMLLPPEH